MKIYKNNIKTSENNSFHARRVLIISPDFPPINKISSLRAYYVAIAFAEAGWDVTVISEYSEKNRNDLIRNELGIEVIRVTSDFRMAWMLKAIFLLVRLIFFRQKFDVVISSHGPSSAHVLGKLVKKLSMKTIWIADYRDLWKSGNYYGQLSKSFYNILASSFERYLIKSANIITTVSKGLMSNLSEFHSKRVEVVYNGFEDSKVFHSDQLMVNEKITICYTGVIYAERNPLKLLQVIERNPNARNKIQVVIAGNISPDVYEQIEKYKSAGVLLCLGEVSRAMSYAIQRSADYCLIVENSDASAKGVLTGKLFEYLAIYKPIIALGVAKNSEMIEIIKKAGVLAYCGNDDIELAEIVEKMTSGSTAKINPNIEFISDLSRYSQSKTYLKLVQEFSQEL